MNKKEMHERIYINLCSVPVLCTATEDQQLAHAKIAYAGAYNLAHHFEQMEKERIRLEATHELDKAAEMGTVMTATAAVTLADIAKKVGKKK